MVPIDALIEYYCKKIYEILKKMLRNLIELSIASKVLRERVLYVL